MKMVSWRAVIGRWRYRFADLGLGLVDRLCYLRHNIPHLTVMAGISGQSRLVTVHFAPVIRTSAVAHGRKLG